MAEEERLRFEVGGKKYHLLTQDGRLYFEDVFDDGSTSCIYEIVFDGRYVKAVYSGLFDKYEHELCQLFDVPKNGWIDYYLASMEENQNYEYFLEVMDKMFGVAEDDEERADRLEKENRNLKQYITRGGFIKDRNRKWCKEGDKIRFEAPNGREFISVLNYDAYAFWVDAEHKNYLVCELSNWFELVEPCEPDVCKDFKNEE